MDGKLQPWKRKSGGWVVYDRGCVVPGLVVVARRFSSLMILPRSNDKLCRGNEKSNELGEVVSPLPNHTLVPRTGLWSVMAKSMI